MSALLSRAGRANVELNVRLSGVDGSRVAVTKNIGVGGMFVATDQPREIGDRLAVTFELPGETLPMTVETEVRWMRKTTHAGPGDQVAGMGLRFLSLPVIASVWIEHFLREVEKDRRERDGGDAH
jgi:uncharacterized protein (TIGR02266 family)